MRKIYLDNIRWVTVLLVLFYHVCYLFNGVGIPGGVPDADSIAFFDWLMCAVYPWFMVLLFVVAGMSARYSLQKRTGKEFLKERAGKLLIPSTLGLFVLHWITGYLNIKMGGGLEYIPSFLVYPISVISGIGSLWFAHLLFLYSCILVLFQKLDKADKLWKLGGRANEVVLVLFALVIWGAAQILNAPVITTYRFGIYFAAFLIGYYIFSHDEVQNKVEKMGILMAIAAVICAAAYLLYYGGSNFTDSSCLQSFFTNLYLWVAVLAVLGIFKKYCNRQNAAAGYFSRNSFGIYVLHYPVLIVTCYVLHYHTGLPAIGKYLLAFVIGFAGTLLLNEVIQRVPFVRYLVLGLKGQRSNPR